MSYCSRRWSLVPSTQDPCQPACTWKWGGCRLVYARIVMGVEGYRGWHRGYAYYIRVWGFVIWGSSWRVPPRTRSSSRWWRTSRPSTRQGWSSHSDYCGYRLQLPTLVGRHRRGHEQCRSPLGTMWNWWSLPQLRYVIIFVLWSYSHTLTIMNEIGASNIWDSRSTVYLTSLTFKQTNLIFR